MGVLAIHRAINKKLKSEGKPARSYNMYMNKLQESAFMEARRKKEKQNGISGNKSLRP